VRARGLQEVLQLARFYVVGGASYVTNLATYALFLWLGLPYLASAAASFLLGFAFNFTANRTWTFSAAEDRASGQLWRFSVVAAVILGLDLILLRVAVEALGFDRFFAQAGAILLLAPLSYFANRLWTFRIRPARTATALPVSAETG
jgi:putative flippase GtrA